MSALLRGLQAFVRGASFVKIAAWWVFLPVFGFFCLLRWLLLPALLLAVMGLALGSRLVGAEPGTIFARLPLRIFGALALLTHAIVIASALVLLLAPWDDGWTQVPGSGSWSDPIVLARSGGGVVIATGGRDKSTYWREPGGDAYEARGLPGFPGWSLADDPRRGRVWLAPRLGDVITFHDVGAGRWLEIAAPVEMNTARGLAIAGDRLLLVGSAGVHWTDDARDGWVLAERGSFTELAIDPAGERLLALGPRFVASWDHGASWREIPRPEGASLGASAAIGGDGRVIVVDGGIVVGGSVWTALLGEAWEPRAAPGADLRAVAVDPRASDHLVVGTWGEGVFRSRDGGRSWSSLGLRGVSVRSLAVDFAGGSVHVASGNLVIRGGVHARSLE